MRHAGPKRIKFVVYDFWAQAWYRAHVPGMELKRRGYEVVLDDKLNERDIDDFDIFVLQALGGETARGTAEHLTAEGKQVVYEVDDDLWHLHHTNPSFEGWNHERAGAEAALRAADLVTTTTPHLAGILRGFNPKVAVLPNMLPREHWDIERQDHVNTIVVGWAGSVSRSWDLRVISTVIPYLLERHPNLEFHVSGASNIEAFPEHERIRLLDPVSIENYPSLLAPFDIGLAPLDDNEFNLSKSDLKFLEYGRLGIPCVASRLEPYLHSIVPGVNGFLAKRERDWLKHVSALIEDAELRARIGKAAKLFAETRIIDDHIELWEKAYGLT